MPKKPKSPTKSINYSQKKQEHFSVCGTGCMEMG